MKIRSHGFKETAGALEYQPPAVVRWSGLLLAAAGRWRRRAAEAAFLFGSREFLTTKCG